MMPASKLLRVKPGFTFDYPFTYAGAVSGPISLVGYLPQWVLTWPGGSITYTNPSGVNLNLAVSRVYFGGQTHDPTNGIIDLVLSATDTAALPWTTAQYTLSLTAPNTSVIPLLIGVITTHI